MQNGWIFKGRRGGCPFYVYLEDEDAGGIRRGGVSSIKKLAFLNAKCGLRNAEFKILKTHGASSYAICSAAEDR